MAGQLRTPGTVGNTISGMLGGALTGVPITILGSIAAHIVSGAAGGGALTMIIAGRR
jgi:hypothetical protein